MKKVWMTVMLLASIFAGSARAQDTQTGPTPFPDAKDNSAWPGVGPIRTFGWMVDNRKYFWTQRQADQGAIVLVGDSLTDGWRKRQKAAFPDFMIANRGIGGDVSRGVLFRFKEDVLDLNPAAVVICIGTNDLSAHANTTGVASNIAAIIKLANEHRADMPIILCNIPPRNHPKAPTKPNAVPELNDKIKIIADENDTVTFVDLHAALAMPDGMPNPEYFGKDQLHIADKGYEKWGQLLTETFKKLNLDKKTQTQAEQ